MAGDGELHLLERGDALAVGRVRLAPETHRVERVHLRGGQRPRGRVRHDAIAGAVLVEAGLARLDFLLEGADLRVRLRADLFEGWQRMMAGRRGRGRGGPIDDAAHASGDGGERLGRRRVRAVAGHSGAHRLGDLLERQLAHAVDDRVGGRVEDDRAPDGVVPEIVMREPAQRRLDAAGEDSHRAAEDAPDHVAVGDQRAVRPAAADAAGRVVVLAPRPLQRGVIVDHRVHRAGRDGEEQPRLAEPRDVLDMVRPRPREDADAEPFRLEHPSEPRRREGGMVHVGVAGDDDHVEFVPAALLRFVRRHGQKGGQNRFRRHRESLGGPSGRTSTAPCYSVGRQQSTHIADVPNA